ncbi:MAG: hypothetical protein DDT40_01690 [candidate division WS2 bacterium]|nr:hypothetical protein [Candidatus Psychracetigena formicireducens]
MPGVFINSNWSHNCQIWSYTNVLEVEALFKSGFPEDAVELAKRCFGNMVEKGPGTLWEMALGNGCSPKEPFFQDIYNSFCHAWGSYISYFLQAYIAGIRPATKGFSKILIAPYPCGLKKIDACVPTPQGNVSVSYKINRGKAVVKINLPGGANLEFDRRGLGTKEVELFVNGKKQK